MPLVSEIRTRPFIFWVTLMVRREGRVGGERRDSEMGISVLSIRVEDRDE